MIRKHIYLIIVLLGGTILNAQEKRDFNLFPEGLRTEKVDLGQNRDYVVIRYQSPNPDGTQTASVQSTIGDEKYLFNDFAYDFVISRGNDGYLLDFMSVLDPKHTRFRKGKTSRSFTGDQIYYPYILKNGMDLPSAEGSFIIKLSGNLAIKQIVALKNRKVEKEESIVIDGKTHKALIVSGVYSITSETNGKIQERTTESIRQWFVVDKGLIRTERSAILN
jgi:hypothetical protein